MLLYSQLAAGHISHVGEYMKYKDSLKAHLKACALDLHKIEEVAQNRSSWRATCRKATEKFEAGRIQTLERKSDTRKQHASTYSLSPFPLLLRLIVLRASSVVHHGFDSTILIDDICLVIFDDSVHHYLYSISSLLLMPVNRSSRYSSSGHT